MKVEADKVLIKLEPIKSLTSVSFTSPVAVKSTSSDIGKKIGVLYSAQDIECAEKIMEKVGGVSIESPLEVFNYKYIIWVASVDGINHCSDVLDTAALYPEKLIIFWWRAVALESVVDVTPMNSREISDSAFAFFPTCGTYIFGNASRGRRASFTDSLETMSQWIKQNKTPNGQRIKCQKFC